MTYLFEKEEHGQLRETVRRFALRHIAPHAPSWEEAEEFPRDLYRQAGEAGLLGIGYPEEWLKRVIEERGEFLKVPPRDEDH